MKLPYQLVDVFTATPLEGNGLAVFPDATGLDTRAMQLIAREMNLSETTFILPGESTDAATRVRIFTPAGEMAFAGHPTIGTAHVMRRLGIVPKDARAFALQENVGRVPVRVDEGDDPIIWLTTPPIARLGDVGRSRCASMLAIDEGRLLAGVPCEIVTAGNPQIFVAVDRPETVDDVRLDTSAFLALVDELRLPACCFVFAPTATGAYSRMFAPELGVVEDPATAVRRGRLRRS
jgi:trans-2,3-dihydro-3-hydroxyanthranilate isomerase